MMSSLKLHVHSLCSVMRATVFAVPFFVTLAPACTTYSTSQQSAGPQEPGASTVSIPMTKGLVWFPFAWTILINQPDNETTGAKLESLQLRQIRLAFRNTATKELITFPMTEPESRASQVALDTSDSQRSFYAPPFVELSEGEYTVESIQALYIDPSNQRPIPMELTIPNPFQSGGGAKSAPLPFLVRKGRVGALARMAMQTTFGNKNGAVVPVSELESVDKDAVPVDVVIQQMNRPRSDAGLVYAASSDFPRARVALTNSEGESVPFDTPIAKIGLLVEAPCKTEGTMKLVWKRNGDDREFASLVNLSRKPEGECAGAKSLASTLLLPKGDWILKSSHITAGLVQANTYKVIPLKQANSFAAQYFSLKNVNPVYAGISLEKDITRQMVVRLESMLKPENTAQVPKELRFAPDSNELEKKVLYIGRIEIVPTEAKNGRAEIWDTLFKRSFSLEETKKAFGTSEIYNAYTLGRITRDRARGTVQSVLRVSSAELDAKKVETFSTELRKNATETLAVCLTEREEFDPLVSISGVMHFSVLKGANAVNIRKLEFTQKGNSEKWVEECFQKKLLAFRFSRKVAANFQGELKFASE